MPSQPEDPGTAPDSATAPREPEGPGPACEPAAGPLSDAAVLQAASYRLTLVRGDGGDRPAWVEGTLRLEARPAALRGSGEWTHPLQGVADIELERVGAHRVGSLDSDDPDAPGVLVLEDRTEPTLMLRFGSSANRMDRQAYDQAFTALTVLEVGSDGDFAGSWRSGMFGDRVTGYFCAVRDSS